MKHLFILLASLSLANAAVVFEQINTNGTGCLPGTVSAVIAPDGSSMSLLFDEFRVEVPNYETPTTAPSTNPRGPNYRPPTSSASVLESSKNCNIVFTTTLPPGQLATGIEISLQARGNTMMDQGLTGYFSTILVGHRGLANSVGPQAKVISNQIWNTPRTNLATDWVADTKVVVPLQSTCATQAQRQIRFELKNHLEAKIRTNDVRKAGIITVDSNDASGILTFALRTAPCR